MVIGVGKKWIDSENVLDIKSIELVNGLHVGGEGKRNQ